MPDNWWDRVWNDGFPPLNLWNYNLMNVNEPRISQAEWDAMAEKKRQWVNDQVKVPIQYPDELTTKIHQTINDVQYGGNHYKSKAIQPWDYVAANNLGYFEGSIIKYVSRWKDKNGVEDLQKARHFLDKLIEVASAKS
jgi:hypothetical protein